MSDSKSAGLSFKVLFYLANFTIAVCVMLASCVWSGIYPFGDRSFLTEDLMIQYVDFFTWFQHVLAGEESLFYSTSQALGNNTWGLYSYYLGSPLNLLIAFFDEGAITEFAFFVVALKVGLIQVATAFFLRRRFGLSCFWSTLLAFGFTWCTWTITNLRNPEWLDALILLPLAAWGVHELVRRGRMRWLIVYVALAIVCCWYTAYMLILFMCLYFALELWMWRAGVCVGCDVPTAPALTRSGEGEDGGKNEGKGAASPHAGSGARLSAASVASGGVWRCIVRFGCSMLAALGLSAFTFVPTVLAMMQKASPQLSLGSADADSISRFLGLASSEPICFAISIALAVALVALAIFALRSKRLSKRASRGLLAALIVTSSAGIAFTLRRVYLITCDIPEFLDGFILGGWSTDHVPQLYGGIILLALAVAFFVAKKVPLDLKVACLAFLAFMLSSVLYSPMYEAWCGFKEPTGFYCRISFLAVFVMLWLAACFVSVEGPSVARRLHPRLRTAACIALAVVSACDIMLSVHLAQNQLYQGYSQSYHEQYMSDSIAENDALTALDDGTYRIAKNYTRIGMAALNEGMAVGYNEMSSYSSAHDANAIAFLNALGYSRVGEFSTRYAYPILASDSLLGVKYVYSTLPSEGYEPISESPNGMGAMLYENPYALSLGYMASDAAADVSLADDDDPFQRQNALIGGLLGYDLDPYVACKAEVVSASDDMVEYAVDVPSGCLAYAFVEGAGDSFCYVTVEGQPSFIENFRFQDSIYGIADASDGGCSVRLSLSAYDPTVPEVASASEDAKLEPGAKCTFYALDMQRFEEAFSMLSKSQAQFECFSGNRISATISLDEQDASMDDVGDGGLLMVSVPASSGWSVKVNGVDVEPVELVGGALTGVPVSPGENTVEMTFTPPGLVLGVAVSVASIASLTMGFFLNKRRGRSIS